MTNNRSFSQEHHHTSAVEYYLYPVGGTRTVAETTLHDSTATTHRRMVYFDISLATEQPRSNFYLYTAKAYYYMPELLNSRQEYLQDRNQRSKVSIITPCRNLTQTRATKSIDHIPHACLLN
jgi:hypothetical protein